MKLVTVYFPPGPDGRYDAARLLRAYKNSCIAHQNVTLEVIGTGTPPLDPDPAKHRWMAEVEVKFQRWCQEALNATESTIFTDADMLLLNDPSHMLDASDVAVTTRISALPPVNTGVLGIRPGPNAHRFIRAWLRTHKDLMANETLARKWMHLFVGTEQASLGKLLMESQFFVVCRQPCAIWNCADAEWATADPANVVFLHVKGRLREKCLGLPYKYPVTPEQEQAIERWHEVWKQYDHD